jgi:hypothetical protein
MVVLQRQREKRQIETPVEQPGGHIFSRADGDLQMRLGEPLAKQPQRPAELMNERCRAGGEVERPVVRSRIVFKLVFDVLDLVQERSGKFRQTVRRGRRLQSFAGAHE